MEDNVILDKDSNQRVYKVFSTHPLIGAHNTFTYLKPKNLWHYFCIPFARCQNKNFAQLINDGVRLFDIRVRFDDSDKLILCHGLFEVKHYFESYKDFIEAIFETIKNNIADITLPYNQCIFRLVLEVSKENIVQEVYFKNFCKYFDYYIDDFNQKNHTCFRLNACVRKFDWQQLYGSDNIIYIKEIQHISSYPAYPESIKVRWYEKICPWLYAKRTNKIMQSNYNYGLYKDYDVISYDFV